MSKVVAVAADPLALELAMTGIEVRVVVDAADAGEVLATLLDSNVDLVVVEEAFREGFSPRFLDRLAEHEGLPLVVYCPAFDAEDDDTDAYVAALIKPALGYEIRLD